MLLIPWNMVGDYSFSSLKMLLDLSISSLPVSECKILIVTWDVSQSNGDGLPQLWDIIILRRNKDLSMVVGL